MQQKINSEDNFEGTKSMPKESLVLTQKENASQKYARIREPSR